MAYTKTYWYLKSGGWSAVAAWAATTGYLAGQWTRQTAPSTGQERCFVCVFAGTSGGSEPTWGITRGLKTTDNTVIWQECTGIPGPNGDVINTSNWTTVKNTAVSLGQVIKDNAATTYFICTTAGTASNGAEPTWNTTAGQTTADGTVTWTSIGAISGYLTPFQYSFARQQSPSGSGFMLAGETCYISNNHVETQSTGMTIANTNGTAPLPLIFLCVNDSVAPPATLATTGTVTTTGNSGLTISGYVYINGITYSCATGATQATLSLSGQGVILDTCSLILGASGAGNIGLSQNSNVTLLNGAMTFGNTGSNILLGTTLFGTGPFLFTIKGGSIAASGSVPTTLFINTTTAESGVYTVQDCDLSTLSGTLVNLSAFNASGIFYIHDCKINASVTPTAGAFLNPYQGLFLMANCDSGSTNYKHYYQTYGGKITQSTSIYNNSGASNGITNLSWQIISTANTTFTTPFATEVFDCQWNDSTGSGKTATIELTCASTLNNNDIWLEIEYSGTSGNPKGVLISSRMAWFGTPTVLTSSASSWTGALANTYKIAVSLTPQLKGPIKAIVYVAKPSLTVNINPMITIT